VTEGAAADPPGAPDLATVGRIGPEDPADLAPGREIDPAIDPATDLVTDLAKSLEKIPTTNLGPSHAKSRAKILDPKAVTDRNLSRSPSLGADQSPGLEVEAMVIRGDQALIALRFFI
jgi:hypothetical protein